jgi:hypothetical protein
MPLPDRPVHGGRPTPPESFLERVRRLAPEGGRVEGLSARGVYVELRSANDAVGGIITPLVAPDDRTVTQAWRQLEELLARRANRSGETA